MVKGGGREVEWSQPVLLEGSGSYELLVQPWPVSCLLAIGRTNIAVGLCSMCACTPVSVWGLIRHLASSHSVPLAGRLPSCRAKI